MFKNLALAIIDEQHRFGVAQRLALRPPDGRLADPSLSLNYRPDTNDAATLGAMLGIVRTLLDSPMHRTDGLYVARVDDGRWEAWTDTHAYEWGRGESEAEVLVGLAEAWKRGQK